MHLVSLFSAPKALQTDILHVKTHPKYKLAIYCTKNDIISTNACKALASEMISEIYVTK